jgi:hypothetical protein
MENALLNESQLRHPWEKTIFVVSVVLNVALMVGAVIMVKTAHDWLKDYPFIAKNTKQIQALAIAAIFALPAIALIRNNRRGFIRGNAVRLSNDQIPEIFNILEGHCKKLGMDYVPELYVSDGAIHEPVQAFSTWKHDFIVITRHFLERKPGRIPDVLAFMLGRELGRIRLGHTKWWYEMILAYVIKIPYLRNPMTHVQTLSHDRYGAFLAPGGIRGLAVQACGRRMLQSMNLEDYLRQVREYGGFWEMLANMTKSRPHISYRIRALLNAGLLKPFPELAPSAESGVSKEVSRDVRAVL